MTEKIYDIKAGIGIGTLQLLAAKFWEETGEFLPEIMLVSPTDYVSLIRLFDASTEEPKIPFGKYQAIELSANANVESGSVRCCRPDPK